MKEKAKTLFNKAKSTFLRLKRFSGALHLILFAAFTVFVFSFMISTAASEVNFELFVGGQSIGAVKDKETLDKTLMKLEADISESMNLAFKYPYSISYSFYSASEDELLSQDELYDALNSFCKNYVKAGYGLYIDGSLLAVTMNENDAEHVLSEILARASERKPQSKLEYYNDIKVINAVYPINAFVNYRKLFSLVLSVMGDDVSFIKEDANTLPGNLAIDGIYVSQSKKNNISNKEMLPNFSNTYYIYPEEKFDKTLYFSEEKTVFYTEKIEHETKYVKDSSIYIGKECVYQEGKDGSRDIEALVKFVAGKVISKTVLSDTVTKNAVEEIVMVGTRIYPETISGIGNKSFIMPYEGRISSYFGYRQLGGAWEYHGALDIAGDTGDTIVAAKSGVVTYAGYMGTYGILVRIDHGNGFETYYAHMSRATVSVGDTVKQGDKIGEIGMTGNTNGPHVHFEIRINNQKYDPLLYIYKEK